MFTNCVKENIFYVTSSLHPYERRHISSHIFPNSVSSQVRWQEIVFDLSNPPRPLVGFYLTYHAPISKAKLHIRVTIMRVNRKLRVFIKFICSSSNEKFTWNRFSVSEYAALLQMWPGRMRASRSGCHKRDSCNPPPHHHRGVLADFPAVFLYIHQRYFSLKKS